MKASTALLCAALGVCGAFVPSLVPSAAHSRRSGALHAGAAKPRKGTKAAPRRDEGVGEGQGPLEAQWDSFVALLEAPSHALFDVYARPRADPSFRSTRDRETRKKVCGSAFRTVFSTSLPSFTCSARHAPCVCGPSPPACRLSPPSQYSVSSSPPSRRCLLRLSVCRAARPRPGGRALVARSAPIGRGRTADRRARRRARREGRGHCRRRRGRGGRRRGRRRVGAPRAPRAGAQRSRAGSVVFFFFSLSLSLSLSLAFVPGGRCCSFFFVILSRPLRGGVRRRVRSGRAASNVCAWWACLPQASACCRVRSGRGGVKTVCARLCGCVCRRLPGERTA